MNVHREKKKREREKRKFAIIIVKAWLSNTCWCERICYQAGDM